ncbi:MAG: histidine phosphatase family protein [Eggerthellaceae bacterium]|nr:histidine phosphatase family protein [Eggerthellaceae bacterium]
MSDSATTEQGGQGAQDAHLKLVIIRHGQTPGNAERRYVGSRDDQPLSEEGRAQARQAAAFPDVGLVYVSSLRRTQETASIMFPNARQEVVPGIQEMDFGNFTGRNADEMADDADYRAWVDSWCGDPCPNGESKAQFNERVCTSMLAFLQDAAARGERNLHLVAHGGTLMAFLDRHGDGRCRWYEWNAENCHGYRLKMQLDGDDLAVTQIERF